MTNIFKTLGSKWTRDYTINYIWSNYITQYGANNIATDKWYSYSILDNRMYVYLDYTILNNLTNINSTTDGFANTINLYDFAGSAASSQAEIALESAYKWEDGKTGEKAFRLSDGVNNNEPNDDTLTPGNDNDLTGILTYILKKNRHYLYDDASTFTITAPIILRTDIKWYLPAYGQFESFKSNPNITDPNGGTDSADDYWSSTAAENSETPENALSYHGGGQTELRSKTLGVIAVRIFDSDTKIIEATATVDNTSLAGGENGDTNQWL